MALLFIFFYFFFYYLFKSITANFMHMTFYVYDTCKANSPSCIQTCILNLLNIKFILRNKTRICRVPVAQW